MNVEPLATPFRGFKLARIVFLRDRLRLAPLHHRPGGPGFYDASGFAVCEEQHEHRPPQWSCTCGFHVVTARDELWRLGWVELATPVLEVELSGRIIEHRHGLRGEYQEVLSVEVPDRCQRCGAPAGWDRPVSVVRVGHVSRSPVSSRISGYRSGSCGVLNERRSPSNTSSLRYRSSRRCSSRCSV